MLYSFDVIDFLDRGKGDRRISIVNWIALSLSLSSLERKEESITRRMREYGDYSEINDVSRVA